jgi:pyruvate dehydrogenase E2 component (dihydrolipoamide acetyltransferase)
MAERVFNLPDLGEGLEDAEIVDWKVAEGDEVELNQPLVEVNTAKALVEIPSPVAGTVRTLHGATGDQVPVGSPLVTFEVADGTPPSAEVEPAAAAGQEVKEQPKGQPKREAVLVGYGVGEDGGGAKKRPRLRPPGPRRAPAAATAAAAPGEIRATPPVRRLARERGVDLAAINGSGPEGRITREDVIRTAEAAGAEAPGAAAAADEPGQSVRVPEAGGGPRHTPGERIPLRGVRRLIAEKMTRSWREIPHVTTFHTIDASNIEALRRELSEEHGTRVSALAIVARALVDVCARHPLLNSSIEEQEIVLHRSCHVGIAADTDRGLVVPVVPDAEAKGITQLAREIAEVVEAARSGRATPDQLTGSTITVSNVGTFGSSYGTPIINAPEAAVLALGRIEPRPVVADGRVEARPAATLSLSFDHRILDGADADRAMTDLRGVLESPFRLGALPR